MPEQQYVSKVSPRTPQGARPKTVKTPNKLRTDVRSETRVIDKQDVDIVRTARQSPQKYKQMPHKSPRIGLVQPRSVHVGTRKKGIAMGRV